jgi:hypothetical protein
MMKKYSIILFFIFAATLFSCQNEDVLIQDPLQSQVKPKYNVTVVDNMLFFKSRDDYEKTINYLAQLGDENFVNWEKEISFNSLRANYKENELEEMGIEDNMLATLLNPKSQIRIGENIFKIDMKNEKVFVIPFSDYSKFYDFGTKKNQRTFSTEDDVLDILEGKATDDILKRKRRFCRSNKLDGSWREPNTGINIKYKVVYQRSGIFKSLQAKIKREGSTNGIELVLKTSGSNFWRNKRDTRNIDNKSLGGFGREYNYRPYNRTRRLKDFRYGVQFEAFNESGWSASRVLILTCRR